MKKFILLSTLAAFFGVVSTTFAAEVPEAPKGATNPLLVTQSWGLTGLETPKVKSGESVRDDWGFVALCPLWAGPMGCHDISGTKHYQDQMFTLFGPATIAGRLR